MITSSHIAEITRTELTSVTQVVRMGRITPAIRGKQGRFDSHMFYPVAALGVAVAVEVHSSKRGCYGGYLSKVYRAFADRDAPWLTKETRGGVAYFVGIDSIGMPIISRGERADPDWSDVARLWGRIKKLSGSGR